MRVLLIDPHAMFRMGMSRLLRQILGDIELLEATDALAALGRMDALTPPDLALVDEEIYQPGVPETAELLSRLRDVPVVVISGNTDEAAMRRALEAGAHAFLLKASSPTLLRHALGIALAGEDYIVCPRPAPGRPVATMSEVRDTPHLSTRQREIMALLGDGKSNKEIARRFGVSEGTVKVHLRTIYKKLRVANRTQAAMIAVSLRLAPESKSN